MKWLILFLLCFNGLYAKARHNSPIEFVIISPSYNNAEWCEKSLQSIASQDYPYWSLIYVNDCSTDSTIALVDAFIKNNHLSHKCKIITNKKRLGAMNNWYRVIKSIPGEKVIVNLDGDDHLAHERVLSRLAQVYANKKTWMTYGNYLEEPNTIPSVCAPFPKKIMRKRKFRSLPWTASHLRTYYAKLFQKIKKKDFLHKDKFVPMACDLAFMFPMLEMASKGHIQYIPEVLYIHNNQNPLNDDKVNCRLQRNVAKKILTKKPYRALKKLFKKK